MSDANKRMGVRATFEVYEDDGGKWRWRMVHRNGNIVADSAEGYSSRLAAVDGLDAVRALAPTARLDVEGADDGEPIPDGGVVAERDEPNLPEAIERVLDDTAGGVDRQVLVERVAELSGATLDEVEEVLAGEIRHGRAVVVDGEVRKTPNRRFAGRSR